MDERKFDVTAQYRIRILSGTEKVFLVRWPTDEEWCEFVRSQKTIRKGLGRGKTKVTATGDEAAAAELLEKILVEAGAVFDEAEAAAVIEKLEFLVIGDVEREGDDFKIPLRAHGANTVHLLRMPTQRQVKAHDTASTSVVGVGRGNQEIRGFLEPSGKLYDELRNDATGYAGAVPIVHKAAAIAELLRELKVAFEDDDDPE